MKKLLSSIIRNWDDLDGDFLFVLWAMSVSVSILAIYAMMKLAELIVN